MRRREFITLLGGAAATWPLAALAQQPEQMKRVGVLVGLAEDDPDTKARLSGLQRGLEKLGWFDGRNVRIDYRFALAQVLAKELIALQPDVVLSQASPATTALQRELARSRSCSSVSPTRLARVFVASLARPGGNITGFLLFEASITGKWLAMLRDIAPNLARAALAINPKTAPYYEYYLRAARTAASSLGIELVLASIENAPPTSSARLRRLRAHRMAV